MVNNISMNILTLSDIQRIGEFFANDLNADCFERLCITMDAQDFLKEIRKSKEEL